MKKKILVGSIIVVALLTLVSFSTVVGFQSVKSDSKIASPLFGIRTNRAINKEQDAITSDYIGKGKAINILLPVRDNKAGPIEKIVDIIQNLNDKAYDKFVNIIISTIKQRDDFQDINNEEIMKSLNQIRSYPDSYMKKLDDDKTIITFYHCFSLILWPPGFCWILGWRFLLLITIIIENILDRFITCGILGDCATPGQTFICRN